MMWYQDDIPHPQLPPATRHEWKEEGDRLGPFPTRDPPAPATVTHLIKYGCKKTSAGTTVPVGPSTSTAPRCVGVKSMRKCVVTSARHSSELMRMEKK